jgi:hypothetical protein
VDLPLPAWHSRGSPYFAEYEQNRRTFLAEHGNQSGLSIDGMPDTRGNNNDDISDEVHPKPKNARIWATQLAAALDAQLATSHALALSQPADESAHPREHITKAFQSPAGATRQDD